MHAKKGVHMKKRPNQILCVIFAFAFILMMGMGHLSAQVPSLLEYDGYLTGNITGNRTIGVRLYNAPTNGTLLYSETIGQVNITNGEFYFQYGQNGTAGNSAMPITIADALTGSQHWLALIINGVEQSPRERLLAVPFALKAKQSDDVQQLTQDLSMVTQAVGRTINVLGGTYSSVSGNLSAAVATLETKASQIQSLQNEGRVIGLSGNFSFGSATLQSNSTRTLTITNSGYAKLNVSGITLPSGFRGTWSGVINSGASQNVTVTFNPSGAQIYSGNITVNSDATSGNGRIPVSGLVPTRQISVSGNLSYGSVLLQGSSTRTLTITNSGNSKLNVSRITLPSGFSGTWSGAINPASSQDVVVKFLPPQVKTYTGNISVASDATSGSGVLAVSGSGSLGTATAGMVAVAGGQSVGAFQIGKYEVTWGEWRTVRDWAVSNGYTDLAEVGETYIDGYPDADGYPDGSKDNFPVNSVSWYDVVKWSNARSEKEGLTPVYKLNGATYKTGEEVPTVNASANGYRLPSVKEWERAARGGVSSKGYKYSGSNTASDVAWTYDNSPDGTKAVGTKAANELGIYDMSGNVEEWCWDLDVDSTRRVCGGNWGESAFAAVVARRGYLEPYSRDHQFGFRLARSSGN